MESAQSYRRRDRALRLTFRFEDGEIELAESTPVDAAVPGSDELDRGRQEQSGFWFELQDADGRPLYRRVMRNPIRANAEIAADGGGFTNRVAVARSGSFSVMVPDVPEATHVALFSSPLDRPHVPEPAVEISREPLRHPQRRSGGKTDDRGRDGDAADRDREGFVDGPKQRGRDEGPEQGGEEEGPERRGTS